MQHQHIKKPEQSHDSDSNHSSVKQVYTERFDAQGAGLPLYLQRSQTQLLQRQPLEDEEEELQAKCENCATHQQALEGEEKTLQEKPDNDAIQQYPQKEQAKQKKPLPHFLQAKLKIGAPNDKYEQEADRVADEVMRMPGSTVQRQTDEEEEPIQTKPISNTITPLIQRQSEPEEEEEEVEPEREEESNQQEPEEPTPILESVPTRDADELGEEEAVQTKPLANTITPLIQRQEEPEEEEEEAEPEKEEEEEPVQTKSISNKPIPATTGLQNQIHSLRGAGQPLLTSERAFFEPRFGADFSHVRIHNDTTSANVARSINAKAFTKGSDVVFGSGEYAPGTSSGRRLLAHELTHTLQQRRFNTGTPAIQAYIPPGGGMGQTNYAFDTYRINASHLSDPGIIARFKALPLISLEKYRKLYLQQGPADLAVLNYIGQLIILRKAQIHAQLMKTPFDLNVLDKELKSYKPLTRTSGFIGYSTAPGHWSQKNLVKGKEKIWAHVFLRNTGSKASTAPGKSSKPAAPAGPSKSAPVRNVKRALVVGGIHGNERGPLDIMDKLLSQLRQTTNPLSRDFDVIAIPEMNPWGVKNNKRKNARGIDLNRNFPGLSGYPAPGAGKGKAPEQLETTAVIKAIQVLKPSRILALHAIGKTKHGGVYADPVEGPARELACRMAIKMIGGGASSSYANVLGNQLKHGVCESRYPGKTPKITSKHTSLGAWASAPKSIRGENIPVITHEVAGKASLKGQSQRLATIMLGIAEFFKDKSGVPSLADKLLEKSATAAFLKGKSSAGKLRTTIVNIVKNRFKDMNNFYKKVWRPKQLKQAKKAGKRIYLRASLTIASSFRSFYAQAGIVRGQLKLRKITSRSSVADIEKALKNILLTRSMPGFSRHHWGTEIDVLSASSSKWKGRSRKGAYVDVIPFLRNEARKFGFFHPYSKQYPAAGIKGYPRAKDPHYKEEPWHISYWPLANVLLKKWKVKFLPLKGLLNETATALATRLKLNLQTVKAALKKLGLKHYHTNISPPPQ